MMGSRAHNLLEWSVSLSEWKHRAGPLAGAVEGVLAPELCDTAANYTSVWHMTAAHTLWSLSSSLISNQELQTVLHFRWSQMLQTFPPICWAVFWLWFSSKHACSVTVLLIELSTLSDIQSFRINKMNWTWVNIILLSISHICLK